jgi:DNA-binding transcriptional MerR regulator
MTAAPVARGAAPRREEDPAPAGTAEAWPPGVSRVPSMNIGAVLGLLRAEFPAVTISKVRFLEEQGLVSPQRTPSGYRRFSQADVERLRFALAAQRDSFMPLRVIRERLDALDAGTRHGAPAARVVAADGEAVNVQLPARLRPSELAEVTGASLEDIGALRTAGLIAPDAGGRYDAGAVRIVTLASALGEHGIDTRHLRSLRTAADRQVDLVAQVTAPARASASSAAQERAKVLAEEVSALCGELHTALVEAGVRELSR